VTSRAPARPSATERARPAPFNNLRTMIGSQAVAPGSTTRARRVSGTPGVTESRAHSPMLWGRICGRGRGTRLTTGDELRAPTRAGRLGGMVGGPKMGWWDRGAARLSHDPIILTETRAVSGIATTLPEPHQTGLETGKGSGSGEGGRPEPGRRPSECRQRESSGRSAAMVGCGGVDGDGAGGRQAGAQEDSHPSSGRRCEPPPQNNEESGGC